MCDRQRGHFPEKAKRAGRESRALLGCWELFADDYGLLGVGGGLFVTVRGIPRFGGNPSPPGV